MTEPTGHVAMSFIMYVIHSRLYSYVDRITEDGMGHVSTEGGRAMKYIYIYIYIYIYM